MRLAVGVLLLFVTCLEAQQASASGVVIDKSTGQPLRGVHLRMITGDFGGAGGVNALYGATTDAAGHFSSENMHPGLYLVMGEKAGFVQLASSPQSPLAFGTLTLKAGQHVTDFKLEMTPHAVIRGRVVDEYGDPAFRASVELQPVPPAVRQESFGGNPNAITDDHGEFRLVATPGKYYLEATFNNPRNNSAEIRTDGSSPAPYAETFYPSAATAAAASVVDAGPGQDVAGMEIRLLHSTAAQAQTFTISGIVTGIPDNGQANVNVQSGDAPGRHNRGQGASTGPDGKFSIAGMEPGYYNVVANYGSGKTALRSREFAFHLVSDHPNMLLTLAPGDELTGTLEIQGSPQPQKHTVRLEPLDGFNGRGQPNEREVEVAKDGSFHLTNIFPGKFKAVVAPMPENGFVKAVMLDNKPATADVLDLSNGGSRIKITISSNGGQISGRVLDKDGDPVMGPCNVVLQMSPALPEENGAARTSEGKYALTGIRPGKYRLYAINILALLEMIGGGDESDAMKQFYEAGEEVEIKEGDRISKDITALSKLPEKK